jgi:hypothetical protein
LKSDSNVARLIESSDRFIARFQEFVDESHARENFLRQISLKSLHSSFVISNPSIALFGRIFHLNALTLFDGFPQSGAFVSGGCHQWDGTLLNESTDCTFKTR